MFGFGFYREDDDDDDDEHKLDRPTQLETILEGNSSAEIPSEASNTLQKTTSQSDLGLVNECCYRNCFEQATMKVKNSSSRMSKFCGFHADQHVTEMLVPITDR